MLGQYIGVYVSAPSAATKIDAAGIIAGCDAVDAEVANLNNLCSEFNRCASSITPKALSFDGMTVGPIIENYATASSGVSSGILGTTAGIRAKAIEVYNKIQEELNAEAKSKDEAAIAAANNRG